MPSTSSAPTSYIKVTTTNDRIAAGAIFTMVPSIRVRVTLTVTVRVSKVSVVYGNFGPWSIRSLVTSDLKKRLK